MHFGCRCLNVITVCIIHGSSFSDIIHLFLNQFEVNWLWWQLTNAEFNQTSVQNDTLQTFFSESNKKYWICCNCAVLHILWFYSEWFVIWAGIVILTFYLKWYRNSNRTLCYLGSCDRLIFGIIFNYKGWCCWNYGNIQTHFFKGAVWTNLVFLQLSERLKFDSPGCEHGKTQAFIWSLLINMSPLEGTMCPL